MTLASAQNKHVGMAYSPWFPPTTWGSQGGCTWAMPALGAYRSDDIAVIDQHIDWLADAGVDFIFLDWSNNDTFYPGCNCRSDLQAIEDASEVIFDRMVWRKNNGRSWFEICIMIGVPFRDAGYHDGSMNRKVNQVKQQYLDNPARRSVYYEHRGLPLLIDYCNGTFAWTSDRGWDHTQFDSTFTIRHMFATLNEQNLWNSTTRRSVNGLWSWDEKHRPSYSHDGRPECVTIHAALRKGPNEAWGTDSVGRLNGETLRKSFGYAREYNVDIALVVSFNEWTGCDANPGEQRNIELSKDIEPMQGGHGDRYLRLLKQEVALFKGTGPYGLRADYFPNTTLTGTPVTVRNANVDFDWSITEPGVTGIGADNWSVRWSGLVYAPVTGNYTFETVGDDGVRLWVNDQQLVNDWNLHPPTTNSGSITLTGDQFYSIRMEYFEGSGGAVAQLRWTPPGGSNQVIPPVNLFPSSNGLRADFFTGQSLTGNKLTRIDPDINYDWGTYEPDFDVGADNFSARWTGRVQPQFSETYTFHTVSDDGVRLWVNNQLLVDNWTSHAPTTNSGNITLVAGQLYDVKMEYFDGAGGAVARLLWSSASQPQQVVPQNRLFLPGAAAVENTPPTISDIADRTISMGSTTGALAFTVDDAETDPALLTLAAASSNTTLVPLANIVFGGSGANRSVTVTPATGQSGTATITVTVSDGELSTDESFLLTVPSSITTIATDGFNTGAVTDNWGQTTTTTSGQWSISQTTPNGGRTVAGNPFGYGGQPAAPQEGSGQAQISNGYGSEGHTATITDTANHYFNVGDQVAIEFFTARRADGDDTGPLGLTVSLVGAGTFSYGTYTPAANTWTQITTNSFTILTAGNYNVQFSSVPEAGDRTSYLDSVSYKVGAKVEPTDAYLDWAATKGLAGPAAAFDADPDGDGIANGLEFVLGGQPNPANPNWNSLGLLPTAQANGDDLVFTFQRHKQAAYLNPTVEFSADLTTPWTTAVHGTNATITVTDAGASETITVTIPKSGASTRFARLKVVESIP